MKKRDMLSVLDERHYRDLDPVNDTRLHPSPERIKVLALERAGIAGKERKKMKKIRIPLLAAALAALLTVTALAMGGVEYFRSVFGDSVGTVADNVSTPAVSVEREDGYTMNAEAVLSDGYKTNVVFSTVYPEGMVNDDADHLEPGIDGDKEAIRVLVDGADLAWDVWELPEYATGNKRYFNAAISTLESCRGKTVKIVKGEGGLTLPVPLNGTTASKTAAVGRDMGGGRTIETVQLSPMGIMVISSETNAKGSLPTVQMEVVMENGKREDVTVEFDSGGDEEGTVTGGGGVVIGGPGDILPLVVMSQGRRNPDGMLVTTGTFSRMLDLSKAASISIDGTEYPFQ